MTIKKVTVVTAAWFAIMSGGIVLAGTSAHARPLDNAPTAPTVQRYDVGRTAEHVHGDEDGAGWNCRLYGNRRCSGEWYARNGY